MRSVWFRPSLVVAVAAVLVVPALAQAADGPIGRWIFDKQHLEGLAVRDLAGKSPAAILGDAKFEQQGNVEVLALDGTTNSVLVADDYTQAAVPKKEITAEAWVRVDKTHEWGGIVGAFQDNGPYEKGWILGFVQNRFSFGLNGTGGDEATTYLQAPDTFKRGVWYHVAGTYDGTTQRVFVNGQEVISSTKQTGDIDYPPTAFYHIGAYRDQDEFFRTAGALREVRVYDRALSADEIKQHYSNHVAQLPQPSPLTLPNIFGSRMVLQRDRPIPVWGQAVPGDRLLISLGEAKAESVADGEGNWKVWLPAQKAGGPLTLKVQGAKHEARFDNVMIGEVWLCSGQSNMQWGVNASKDRDKEIAAANHPNIRLFTVPNVMTPEPQENCDGGWDVCRPEVIGGFSAVGYYFGRDLQQKLDVPVGLINASWGGSACEAWMSREALEADPDYAPILERSKDNLGSGRGMYNAMIHPLIPYAIRGAIWYQGESNCQRAVQYRKLFPAMIADWRKRWGQGDFPFYYVQLAPFDHHHAEWPELWEAQLMALKVPQTGMAVTTDIGELKNIHPLNKQEVGRRLALWALANTYGQKDLVYSGPLYRTMEVEQGKIRLQFDHAQGLKSRDGQPLNWFTIAGEDQQFKPATATIQGESVIVHSDEVKSPVAVRFGWSDVAQPNLVNGAGLPASPFRTDDWPAVTASAK